MNTWNKTLVVGLAAAAVAITAPAPAYAYVQPIAMNINQSYYLNTGSSITRVAVANQEIADIKVLGASAINVVAKKAGTTTLNVWTSNGMRQEYMVVVSNEDKGLASVIEKAIDLPNVHVQMVEKRVLLRGTVQVLLPDNDVYITDWTNARDVPLSAGRFGLDDPARLWFA